MKFSKFTFAFSLIFLLTKCNPNSDKTNGTFKNTDKSLEKSLDSLGNSFEEIYESINSNRHLNNEIAIKADSIYTATIIANKFIDSLKEFLRTKDTSGTNTKLSTQIFISSSTGDQLKEKIKNVYFPIESIIITSTDVISLNKSFNNTNIILSLSDWKKDYFNGVPTVAAITILNKFQNDYFEAAKTSLKLLKSRLGKITQSQPS